MTAAEGSLVLPATAWLSRKRTDLANAQIVEQAAVVLEIGAVFSLLWIVDLQDRICA